jgi:hypothetical protein
MPVSYTKPERKFLRKQHRKKVKEAGGSKKKGAKAYKKAFPKPTGVKVFIQHAAGKKIIHTATKGYFTAKEIRQIRKGKSKGLLK